MIHQVLVIILISFKVSNGFNVQFWHICDIHLKISNGTSQSIYFGDYFSDSPLVLVKSAIFKMKNIQGNPNFIIWNGDNAPHTNLNDNEFNDTTWKVGEELNRVFNSTNILPSLGNHDLNPSDNFVDNSTCLSLLSSWEKFFNNSEEEKSFKHGCYYSRIVNISTQIIKVIVLNTIIWYSNNKVVYNTKDPFDQFTWMKDQLKNARSNNSKVFIVGHVPPGASEYSPQSYRHLRPEFNDQLLKILQDYSDIIEAGFFAHQHTDSFKVVYDVKGKPVIPLFLSPSVSPFYLRDMGSVNPSIRLYTWSSNVSHRFYSQYHAKLPDDSRNKNLTWSLEYNSTDILPSLSAAHLDSLLTDFSSNNSLYFSKYFGYHLSGRPHDNNETCPVHSFCRCRIVCAMRHILYSDLDFCLTNCTSVKMLPNLKPPVHYIVAVIAVFSLILIVTVIGVNKVYCHHRRSASLTRDIFMASYNGKNCEQIVSDHIDHIAEVTFGDVPKYKGHMRDNSRTILTLNDGNELVDTDEPPVSSFAISSKSIKSQEKYAYSRM